jgi:lipoprotein NlpI
MYPNPLWGSITCMDAWTLFKNDRHADAAAAYTQEIHSSPSPPVFNNRGLAYLNLGDFDAALSDFRSADALDGSSEHAPSFCGVALWLGGFAQDAITAWSAGVEAALAGEIRYADAAGGVTIGNLLMFAGVRCDNSDAKKLATRLLRKRLRAKQSAAWPGPVSRYLLGDSSEADLLSRVSRVPILRERELCQALFYTGVRALSVGDAPEFARAMNEAVQFGRVVKLEAEYYLALHENRQHASTST